MTWARSTRGDSHSQLSKEALVEELLPLPQVTSSSITVVGLKHPRALLSRVQLLRAILPKWDGCSASKESTLFCQVPPIYGLSCPGTHCPGPSFPGRMGTIHYLPPLSISDDQCLSQITCIFQGRNTVSSNMNLKSEGWDKRECEGKKLAHGSYKGFGNRLKTPLRPNKKELLPNLVLWYLLSMHLCSRSTCFSSADIKLKQTAHIRMQSSRPWVTY